MRLIQLFSHTSDNASVRSLPNEAEKSDCFKTSPYHIYIHVTSERALSMVCVLLLKKTFFP